MVSFVLFLTTVFPCFGNLHSYDYNCYVCNCNCCHLSPVQVTEMTCEELVKEVAKM